MSNQVRPRFATPAGGSRHRCGNRWLAGIPGVIGAWRIRAAPVIVVLEAVPDAPPPAWQVRCLTHGDVLGPFRSAQVAQEWPSRAPTWCSGCARHVRAARRPPLLETR